MKRCVSFLLLFAALFALVFLLHAFPSRPGVPPYSSLPAGIRVFDGDTAEFPSDGGAARVRYLLVDTPELHHPSRPEEELGEEARLLNCALLASGPIRFEHDVERTDRYGRTLAYVFAGEEGSEVFVNELLVREGLAQPLVIPPNRRYAARIFNAFEEARAEQRGLWGRAQGRIFTSAQAWSEAPLLAGSFLSLFMTIESAELKGRRILLREGRVTVAAYKSPETEGLLSLRKGDRIRAVGKLLLTYNGCELPVASEIQISRITD